MEFSPPRYENNFKKISMPEGPEQYTPPETEGRIDLHNLLTYDNPNLLHYQKLIERERGGRYVFIPQQFSQDWEKIYFNQWAESNKRFDPAKFEKARVYFYEKLHDSLFIDVGGGEGNWMREFAKKFGAQRYVNVDVFGPGESLDPFSGTPAEKIDYQGLKEQECLRALVEIYVTSDMLDFVARLPDNSANFAINGIDLCVVLDKEYREALISELIRAAKVSGILFGSGSDIWRQDIRLRYVTKELGLGRNMVVAEKIKE